MLREWSGNVFESVLGIDRLSFKACQDAAVCYQHKETGERQLRAHTCNERGYCPACSIRYGLEVGLGVLSLFKALYQPHKLLKSAPYVKAWALVFTLPKFISLYLDGLVDSDLKALRRALRQLTGAVKETLIEVFGEGVAAKLNWHWWNSEEPLTPGGHWHAHALVPNLRKVGDAFTLLRGKGELSGDELENLKRVFAAKVAALPFVRALGKECPAEFVVNIRFMTKLKGGKYSLAHRCRYDYRHPMQDLQEYVKRTYPKGEMPPEYDPGGAWFLSRCAALQPIQLSRAIGWMTNASLATIGLKAEGPKTQASDWIKVPGWYKFGGFTPSGVEVTVWHDGVKSTEFWKASQVKLLKGPMPKRYVWQLPIPTGPPSGSSPPSTGNPIQA